MATQETELADKRQKLQQLSKTVIFQDPQPQDGEIMGEHAMTPLEKEMMDSNSNINDIIKSSIALRDDPHYRINPDRFWGLFRAYVRQDWGTVNTEEGGELSELRAGWLELFFDLIFVAGIVHISTESVYALDEGDSSHRRLASTGTDSTYTTSDDECANDLIAVNFSFLFCTFVQFGLFQLLWQEQVMLESRFVCTQQFDATLRLIYMASILAMGISVHDEQEYFQAFLFGFAMAKFGLLLLYSKISLIPRARNHCFYWIIMCGFQIVASIILCFTIHGDSLLWLKVFSGMYVIYYIINTGIWWFPDKYKKDVAIPVNVPHIAERLGLFTMLILGESIISLMTADLTIGYQDLGVVFTAFILVYCLGLLYFACQPSEEQIISGTHTHAMRHSKNSGRMFGWAHTFLYFSLLGLGVGMKVSLHHLDNECRQAIDVMLPAFSLCLACLALNMIRLAHPFEHRKLWVWVVRAICMIIMFIAPWFWKENNYAILAIEVICIVIQVLIDEEGKQQREEERKEIKHQVNEAVKRQQTGVSRSGAYSVQSKSEITTNTNTNNNNKDDKNDDIVLNGISPSSQKENDKDGNNSDSVDFNDLDDLDNEPKQPKSEPKEKPNALSPSVGPRKHLKRIGSGVGIM